MTLKTFSSGFCLKFSDFPNLVGDALVVHVAAVDALHIAHHPHGDGQDDDLVQGFQHDLQCHHCGQLLPRDDPAKGDGEEQQRVRRLAHHGGGDGPHGEVTPATAQLHPAHDVGIEERTHEEGCQTGRHDAGRHAEDEVEVLASRPEGRGRQGYGHQSEGNDKEVHHEARPDDEPRLAEAPHLGDAVVDDVGHGEDQQAGGDRQPAEGDNLGFEKIGCDEAYVEEDAQQHEGYGYGLFHFPVFYVVKLEYTEGATRSRMPSSHKIGRKDTATCAIRQEAGIKKVPRTARKITDARGTRQFIEKY